MNILIKHLYLSKDKIDLWAIGSLMFHFENKTKLLLVYNDRNSDEFPIVAEEEMKLITALFKAKSLRDYRKEKGYGQ